MLKKTLTAISKFEQEEKRKPTSVEDSDVYSETVFDEDFENWNINGWTITELGTDCYVTITPNAIYTGSYGMRCILGSTADFAKRALIENTFTPVTDTLYFEAYIMFKSITLSSEDQAHIVELGHSVVGSEGCVLVKESDGSYYIGLTDDWGNEELLLEVTTDTWYHLEVVFKASNTTTGAWIFTVNDATLYKNLAIRTVTSYVFGYLMNQLKVGPYVWGGDETDEIDIDYDDILLKKVNISDYA